MQHSTEGITDDAMVVEQEMGIESVMVKGGYENIKITTPEDLLVAESFLAEKIEKSKIQKANYKWIKTNV